MNFLFVLECLSENSTLRKKDLYGEYSLRETKRERERDRESQRETEGETKKEREIETDRRTERDWENRVRVRQEGVLKETKENEGQGNTKERMGVEEEEN